MSNNIAQNNLNVAGFIAMMSSMQSGGVRGPLSNIERAISETQRYRAYEYIAKFCDLENNQHVVVMCMIGGMFVKNKCRGISSDSKVNFGASMLALANHPKTSANSIDRRMKQIIANSSGVDACQNVVHVLELMRTHSVGVDFASLITDLVYWNDKTIRRWAYSYYTGRHA